MALIFDTSFNDGLHRGLPTKIPTMSRKGPIIIAEDDQDDRDILVEVFQSLGVKNELKFFEDGEGVLDYLMTTEEKPFLILTDVNLPRMRGTELRKRINEDETLRRKSIPFIFLTTSADRRAVSEAFNQMVQGYFQKEIRFEEVKKTVKLIVDYWMVCKHPNNVE